MKPKIRAYSYIRFSTPEQAKGDSLRRQLTRTAEYCAEHGLVLDERLRDAGVSAFSGANRTIGALAGFLKRVEKGDVEKGSFLIIESLDRLSREAAFEAQYQLLSLLRAGVSIVTLIDKTTYSKAEVEKNPALLVYATMIAMRAHDESAHKQDRLKNNWIAKRERIAAGTHVRMHLPAWLRWDVHKNKIVVIPERGRIVHEIFEKRAAGWSRRRIAQWLNEKKIAPWGPRRKSSQAGWHDSYINKLLSSRSVFGEHQPHVLTAGRNSARAKAGEPIRNYFPAVVTEKLFHSVQSEQKSVRPIRGRPTTRNLFGGLVFDGDGAPLHYLDKGDGCRYLTTSLAFQRRGKKIARWRYDHFEEVFLHYAVNVNWPSVLRDEASTDRQRIVELKGARTAAQERIAALQIKIDRATTMMLDESLGVVSENLRSVAAQLTQERQALHQELTRIETELDAATRAHETAKLSKKAITENLSGSLDDPSMRERVREEIRRLVTRITLFPDGHVPGEEHDLTALATARLTGNRGLVARQAGRVVGAFTVEFVNGKTRTVWVPYRPSARADEEPAILGISGAGFTEAEWEHETALFGHTWIPMDEVERLAEGIEK